jgi:antitoxin component of RelBE/YafQ-DinJ toxin-antitoxin module
MPTETATKPIRISVRRLAGASKVLDQIGLDTRSAIELFLAQVESRKALPFVVALPDSEYAAAAYGLTDAEVKAAGKRMRRAASAEKKAGSIRAVDTAADLLG